MKEQSYYKFTAQMVSYLKEWEEHWYKQHTSVGKEGGYPAKMSFADFLEQFLFYLEEAGDNE